MWTDYRNWRAWLGPVFFMVLSGISILETYRSNDRADKCDARMYQLIDDEASCLDAWGSCHQSLSDAKRRGYFTMPRLGGANE
jgi:hypothetical protein